MLDFEITGEEPKLQISFKSNNYSILFRVRGEEIISKRPSFNPFSTSNINKFDFSFCLKSEDFTIDKEELNIAYGRLRC